ncbi:unnamed protein product [Penicillium pancosmium]
MKASKSRRRFHDVPRNGAVPTLKVPLVRRNGYPCRTLSPEPLAGPFGGILADEMGLGKTLTTLATILSTLDNATTWLLSKPSGSLMCQRSKATVIVVPSEGDSNPTPTSAYSRLTL